MRLFGFKKKPDDEPVTFAKVLRDELVWVDARRRAMFAARPSANTNPSVATESDTESLLETEELQTQRRALQQDLVGLAFSGGGIRSATFNLGVLQALASLNLLARFDYLSTVSGGGYIGGWLAAWIKRESVKNAQSVAAAKHGLVNVEKQLSPNRKSQAKAWRFFGKEAENLIVHEEPEPVYHLRAYSRYLAPKVGLLTGDTWALVALYLRNLLINLTILIPATIVVVLGCRVVNDLFQSGIQWPAVAWWYGLPTLLICMVLCAFAALCMNWKGLSVTFTLDLRSGVIRFFRYLTSLFGTMLVVALSLFTASCLPWNWTPLHMRSITVFGPPALAVVLFLGFTLMVAIFGRLLNESSREWWARVSGLVLRNAVLWLAILGLCLFGPELFSGDVPWKRIATYILSSGWLGSTIAGVLLGKSEFAPARGTFLDRFIRLTPTIFLAGLLVCTAWFMQKAGAWATADDGVPFGIHWGPLLVSNLQGLGWYSAWVLVSAGWVRVNMFSLHSMYASRLRRCYLGASRRKLRWGERSTGHDPANVWRPGPGGAPTGCNDEPRREDLFCGLDSNDDFPLVDLQTVRSSDGQQTVQYAGPLHVFNTALNLTAGRELAWQDRKADSFALTPRWCGSPSTGYRQLPGKPGEPRSFWNRRLTVGRAMAISGAALSPNMGYHSSPSLAALMTIFNVRLGWWMENPRNPKWNATGPGYGGLVFGELTSQTKGTGKYVYLSDGGHFDNLGIYELVRRRCRFIVVCDAGADASLAFQDLAEVTRRCRNDFGVRIEIDVTPLQHDPQTGLSQQHCVSGTIHYDDADPLAVRGTLLYLKPTLTGNEPVDIRNYVATNPEFPHQSTANQFFASQQFESYRALGYHVAMEAFAKSSEGQREAGGSELTYARLAADNQRLFASLYRRWQPAPPDLESVFLKAVEGFAELQAEFRRDDNLRDFTCDLYPELEQELKKRGQLAKRGPSRSDDSAAVTTQNASSRDDPLARHCAELHAVVQMLQVMENAWVGLQLDAYRDHPLNRGWMNVFRRWTNSETMHRHWPAIRGEFSEGFVAFCEKELRLTFNDGREHITRLPMFNDPATRRGRRRLYEFCKDLAEDFKWEWPAPVRQIRGRIASAQRLTPDKKPPVWIIWMAPGANFERHADSEEADGSGIPRDAYACGIVLITKVESGDSGVPTFELFMWLRGAYRNVGIAGRCLDKLQPKIEEAINAVVAKNGPRCLQVRYPAKGITGSGDRTERAMWRSFFESFGFRPTTGNSDDGELLLERQWNL